MKQKFMTPGVVCVSWREEGVGAISTLTAEVLAKRGMKLFAANLDSSSV